MLKHATITRISRAQQTLQLQKQWNQQHHQSGDEPLSSLDFCKSLANNSGNNNNNNNNNNNISNNTNTNDNRDPNDNINDNLNDSPPSPPWSCPINEQDQLQATTPSCSSSPTPSAQTQTPTSKFGTLSSAPSSLFSSPSKSNPNANAITDFIAITSFNNKQPTVTTTTRCGSESMIKVFAQTLSQDVEYVTLHVNAQTKSQQIIRSLLKKFRLKHRDPNLFYLTLERWIRKDGLKFKSVMLLSDEACPLQLQQCCSNPPHNDIKFTLQVRAGALMKIYCYDVCPDTRYKCLSLSTQTTVDETIELMLHCLNLVGNHTNGSCVTNNGNQINNNSISNNNQTNSNNSTRHRLAGSPGLTDSSSTSSSSGIESDPTNQNSSKTSNHLHTSRLLDSDSRTSSVTSISSSSNMSNDSSGSQLSEQYCLIIECKDTNYRRILESDEYLVDIYQNLLEEAREQPLKQSSNDNNPSTSSLALNDPIKQQPDQWFFIKLKRRDEISHQSIKFTNPRQNMPLPPIPLSLAQLNNANDLQHIVTTTQIEVNHRNRSHHQQLYHRPSSSLALNTTATINGAADTPLDGRSSIARNCHRKQLSTGCGGMPPPPASLIWLPPIRPRRRNLSNASTSTFGRPQNGASTGVSCNRRRYDPAQLAEDLNKLDMNDGSPQITSDLVATNHVSRTTATTTTSGTFSELTPTSTILP